MLNFSRPHVRASVGVDPMKTLGGMKVPMLFTSLLAIQPRRKVRSAWMAGLASLSRFLMLLYVLMAYRSAPKHS